MPNQRVILGLVLAILLLTSVCRAQVKPEQADLRLLFTGDIMLSRQVQTQYQLRKRSPWINLKTLFADADWVSGNFEGAIGNPSDCLSLKNCFATQASILPILRDAGLRGLTIENNHSGDVGASGREATRTALQQAGLMPVSFDSSPQFLRLRNTTIALVAITLVRAADGQVQSIPSLEVAQKLRTARRLANIVVVSIHWGAELIDWPTEMQHRQAEWLVDHGADLVVGHHPHVVQAPECVHGRPVFFSLGNHVFDQKYLETKEGMIADCRIHAGRLSCDAIRTHTDPGSYLPDIAGGDSKSADVLNGCSPALTPALEIGGYEIRPEPWSADASEDGIALTGWKKGTLQWRTPRRKLLSIDSGRLAGADAEPLLLILERHSSSLDNEEGVRPYVYAVGEHGLIARWRGSALAWPLLDAAVDDASGTICALHRGDSFLSLDRDSVTTRTAVYRWNGFGFSGVEDVAEHCAHSVW
jgi:poly-gamma-glutamate synthesis protein (capsule biosynthesis protein)